MDYKNIDWIFIHQLITRANQLDDDQKFFINTIIEDAQNYQKTREGRLYSTAYQIDRLNMIYEQDYPFVKNIEYSAPCEFHTEASNCEYPDCSCYDKKTAAQEVHEVKKEMERLRNESRSSAEENKSNGTPIRVERCSMKDFCLLFDDD